MDATIPSVIYFLAHDEWDAVKIGIANHGPTRLNEHAQHGWYELAAWNTDTGRQARFAEQAVLNAWRRAGIPQAARREGMPRGGHSETAPRKMVDIEKTKRIVEAALTTVPPINFAEGIGGRSRGSPVRLRGSQVYQVGPAIKTEMRRLGWTRRDLADRSGMSYGTLVPRLKSGFTIGEIDILAETLGVTQAHLLG